MEELTKQEEDFVLEMARDRDKEFIEALEDWTGRNLLKEKRLGRDLKGLVKPDEIKELVEIK